MCGCMTSDLVLVHGAKVLMEVSLLASAGEGLGGGQGAHQLGHCREAVLLQCLYNTGQSRVGGVYYHAP